MNRWFLLLVAALCVGICSCSPPGPRALLRGKELIDEGRHAEAVEPLERATALLPKNALAWNYLGLAYHGTQQSEPAIRAYRTALALDHKLIPVRYNLGCLYLEENNLAAATDELKSYTLLMPGAVEGWLKLGAAQLRARRLDDAERSFRTAIELQVRNAEALNGLGLIQMQRGRWLDANSYFTIAAMQEPPYAPAVLNSAVVLQQYLRNRSMALQRYRQYLAIQPRPADWESVETAARQLELEMNPLAAAPKPAANPTPAAPSPVAPRSNNATIVAAPAARGAPTPGTAVAPAPATRTNPVVPPVATKAPASSNLATSQPAATPTRPVLEPTRVAVKPPAPRPIEATPATPTPMPARATDLEVSQVPTDVAVRPAQELSRSRPEPELVAPEPHVDRATSTATGTGAPQKRGLLSRLNPFSGKAKPEAPAGSGEAAKPPIPMASDPGSGSTQRYSYLSPTAPTPGSRSEGEKAFKRAVDAHRDGDRAQAVREYRKAVASDPAYYDAYYNLGLVALEVGDARLSLWAYEIALSLKPDSADARYNFALALKSGGYSRDAVDQLLRILSANSDDARAHLSAANLYAQQLRQSLQAREHYQRVLEINPRHPEASKIRFWLAANP